MKQALFLSLVALISFSSCKKDKVENTVAEGTITFKVDGQDITYKTYAAAVKNSGEENTQVSIIGAENTSETGSAIVIILSSTSEITTGAYHEKAHGGKAAMITFKKSGEDSPYITIDSPANPTVVDITSITGTSIQGTFKGDIFFIEGGAGADFDEKAVISEGKFNLTFTNPI